MGSSRWGRVMLCGLLWQAAISRAETWKCEEDVDGFIQQLEVSMEADRLMGFRYSGSTTAFDAEVAACRLSAERDDGEVNWNLQGHTTTISYAGHSNEQVKVSQMGTTLIFDLSGAAPWQCGKQAVSAATIAITQDEPHCHSITLRQ
ncbi:hypothetical protein QCD60_15210 [Pokkaliibacter sp. MBI-7]|uniref:hypothetical protein n=1 Tax=Pokkaliibacter sp. MBI-7 TaxID=3040600 RepID=UPI002446D7DC|nr:hypothetical protein [Pokkaliibacter sp. MBI-7]MDH2433913.1 hypothetical protein [Pokkaliibacter sp. MBI-7]